MRFKPMSVLLAGSIAFVVAGNARSADLVEPAAAPAPAYSWSGIYVGGLLGYGTGHKDWTLIDNAGPGECSRCGTEVTSFGVDSFVGGFQIGYNYDMGGYLLGLEGDILFGNMDGKGTWTAEGGSEIRNGTSEINWLATVGPRIGAIMNQSLVYIEGGLAFADEEHSHLGSNDNVFTGDETRHGWFIGGGVEYLIDADWSVKAEYNYIDLGSERVSLTRNVQNNNTAIFEIDQNIHTIKVGLSYNF